MFYYLGMIIERGAFGWYVIDWDMENPEGWPIGQPHKSKSSAMRAVERLYHGI